MQMMDNACCSEPSPLRSDSKGVRGLVNSKGGRRENKKLCNCWAFQTSRQCLPSTDVREDSEGQPRCQTKLIAHHIPSAKREEKGPVSVTRVKDSLPRVGNIGECTEDNFERLSVLEQVLGVGPMVQCFPSSLLVYPVFIKFYVICF